MKQMLINAACLLLMTGISAASDGWDMDITAKIQKAENRAVIGQKPDATDGFDGKYDVPAMLAGDVEAFILTPDGKAWKDIQAECASFCTKKWKMIIRSGLRNKQMRLSWNAPVLPAGATVTLLDLSTDKKINMKARREYVYRNNRERVFIIKVSR